MARSVMTDDGAVLSTALDGYKVLFKRRKDDEEATIIVGTLNRKQAVTPVIKNGKYFIIGEDGVLFVSTNGGATWKPRSEVAAEIAQENL